jgi:hypothetical protein
MRKKKSLLWLFAALLFGSMSANAQVTIGSGNMPSVQSLLDIDASSVKKGLHLPRITTAERNALVNDQSSAADKASANGLAIYNTETDCFEYWNAEEWISLCEGNSVSYGLVTFGSCDLIEVVGFYDMDKAINEQTMRIDIPVTVKKMGYYKYTGEVNGVTFVAEGNFITLGPSIVSMFPTSGAPTNENTNTYNMDAIIAPVEGNVDPEPCAIPVTFFRRSDATLKILNFPGNTRYTGLISGTNYSANTVYGTVGDWLDGDATTIDGTALPAATTVAGAGNVIVKSIPATTKLADIQRELATASIVWVGSSDAYTPTMAQLLADWSKMGKGIILITGDKTSESVVSDALGYYIEDGDAATGTFYGGRLPQIFDAANGAPFNLGNGLSIGYSGDNCGYVTSNSGVTLMEIGANKYPSAFADIDNGVFIFGDKFGETTATTSDNWKNFAKVLTDIFAWSLKNAPVY